MRLLIHDIPEAEFVSLVTPWQHDTVMISALGKYAPCQGCFDCWLKTPGVCRIKDELQHIGRMFGASDEVIIISENWYGGYSAAVKNLLDRSISTSLPFFTFRGGRLHHIRRYKNDCALRVILYGECTEIERETARATIAANQHNSGYRDASVSFVDKLTNIEGVMR